MPSSLEYGGELELAECEAEYGLAYIVYMRLARRVDGVKASRLVFDRARKDWVVLWEVQEAWCVSSLSFLDIHISLTFFFSFPSR